MTTGPNEEDAAGGDAERAAALYRKAIGALSLYSYPASTIDALDRAVRLLQSVSRHAECEALDELTRLKAYYLEAQAGAPDPVSIRSSLCADLHDRNASAKNHLATSLDRIDEAVYYARGNASFVAIIPLYRQLFGEAGKSLRFPDLDVSDWLFGFAGLLLNNGDAEEGQVRLQQSLSIEALLSGGGSERTASRLRWRGGYFARRGCSSCAEADLVRAMEILSALGAPERGLVESTLDALTDLQGTGISSKAISLATEQGSACLARLDLQARIRGAEVVNRQQ